MAGWTFSCFWLRNDMKIFSHPSSNIEVSTKHQTLRNHKFPSKLVSSTIGTRDPTNWIVPQENYKKIENVPLKTSTTKVNLPFHKARIHPAIPTKRTMSHLMFLELHQFNKNLIHLLKLGFLKENCAKINFPLTVWVRWVKSFFNSLLHIPSFENISSSLPFSRNRPDASTKFLNMTVKAFHLLSKVKGLGTWVPSLAPWNAIWHPCCPYLFLNLWCQRSSTDGISSYIYYQEGHQINHAV